MTRLRATTLSALTALTLTAALLQSGGAQASTDTVTASVGPLPVAHGQNHPDGLEPGPNNVPSYCARAVYPADYLLDRHAQCQGFTYKMSKTGGNPGTASLVVYLWTTLPTTGRAWVVHTAVREYESSGSLVDNVAFDSRLVCSANCIINGRAPADYPIVPHLNEQFVGDYNIADQGNATESSAVHLSLSWTTPGSANVNTQVAATSRVRCDNVSYINGNGGCVYSSFVPSWKPNINNPDYGDSIAFIKQAQQNLPDHWGVRSYGPASQLTRQYPIPSNARAFACRYFNPGPSPDSCDEFPFNATYQNALAVGRNRAAIGHVPLGQNTRAGSALNSFYRAQRILNKDAFYVEVQSDRPGVASP